MKMGCWRRVGGQKMLCLAGDIMGITGREEELDEGHVLF